MAYDSEDFEQKLQRISQNDSDLVRLVLSHSGLGSRDIALLAHALVKNTHLTELDLSDNHIRDGDVNVLLRALINNNTMTTLNLSSNKIGSEGVIALANNNTISTLDLKGNNIRNEDAKAILTALKKNTTLIWLNYAKNPLSDGNSRDIQEEVKINRGCHQIIKEQIRTLMNIRAFHSGSPIELMPVELMFLFFQELMPEFEPSRFMQQKFELVDEATKTQARNKLKAIAAQTGSIKNSNVTPAHYYAITRQPMVTRANKTQFSAKELRQVLDSSTHCFLYSTAERAQQKRLAGTKKRSVLANHRAAGV